MFCSYYSLFTNRCLIKVTFRSSGHILINYNSFLGSTKMVQACLIILSAQDLESDFLQMPWFLLFGSGIGDHSSSLVAQSVKNLPAVQEIWVLSLGWEDPLEKEMATHSSILAWKMPWTEEPGGLQSMRSQSRAQMSN